MATPHATAHAADMLIRPAAPEDVAAVVDVLSAAFADDPVLSWIFPDPARRAVLNPGMFRLIVEGHLPLGEIHVATDRGDLAAVAVWAPAGLEPDPEGDADGVAAFVVAAEEYADRASTILAMMAEVHPHTDHAYLFLIGTLPARQGAGIGSTLLGHTCERLDRQGTAAYLEATCEDNRRLYRRHGFADVGVIQLPDGPPMFRMWRAPR